MRTLFTDRQIAKIKRYLRLAGFIHIDEFAMYFIKYYWANVSTPLGTTQDIGAIPLKELVESMSKILSEQNVEEWTKNGFETLRNLIIKRNAFVHHNEHKNKLSICYHVPGGLDLKQNLRGHYIHMGPERFQITVIERYGKRDEEPFSLAEVLAMSKIDIRSSSFGDYYCYAKDKRYVYRCVTSKRNHSTIGKTYDYMIARDHLVTLNMMSKKRETVAERIRTMTFLTFSLKGKMDSESAEIIIDYMFV